MRGLLRILVSLLAVGWLVATAAAEPRTALVIGNSAYPTARLANPANDARDVAASLRNSGFDVTLKTDADQRAMDEAIKAFGETLKAKGGVGLFYFAGHGVQLAGDNFILPVGDDISSERDVKYRAVNAQVVLDEMAEAKNGLNIVVLDACRNNPFASTGRSLSRGLARMESNSGLFLSFSTSPNSVALDGDGRNSPYTKHLIGSLNTPNLTLEETFKRTLKGVHMETDGKQTPWISSSFFGDFVFQPGGGTAVAAAPQPAQSAPSPAPAPVVPPGKVAPGDSPPGPVAMLGPRAPIAVPRAAPALAGLYRVNGTNPNGSRYSGMAALTPAHGGYKFRWWIQRQVFNGTGQFAGRMMVVDWGAKHPVIYTIAGDRLEGEWADGSATDTLVLFAPADEAPVSPPSGAFRVEGRNPNGSRYGGTATIVHQSGRYLFEWRIGSRNFRGTGTLDGNIMTVDWGSATPVIYAVGRDGALRGLWEAGKGEDILTLR